jgi:hypothetical protein
MESLGLMLFFSVVVVAWVMRIIHVRETVPSMKQNWLFWPVLSREQRCEGVSMDLRCSVPVSVPIERSRFTRLRGDGRIDSGRGRPLLCLN